MDNIPQIGFGTYQLTLEQADQMVYRALEAGYRHFDTAQLYQNEIGVGRGINRGLFQLGLKREDVWVTTKVRSRFMKYGRESIIKSVRESLDNLNLDYIDLLLLHVPIPDKFVENWQVLEDIVLGLIPEFVGRVRRIGVSNFNIKELDVLLNTSSLRVKPFVNQFEISPFCPRTELTGYCQIWNICVVAHSSLTKGKRLRDEELRIIVDTVSSRLGVTVSPAQVLLAWSLQKGYGILPRTLFEFKLKQNWEAQYLKLDESEMWMLSQLNDGFSTHPKLLGIN